jgi:hypothetical protein
MHVGEPCWRWRACWLRVARCYERSPVSVACVTYRQVRKAILWRPWWYALSRSRGASYDVAHRIEELLDQTGFVIHRCDRYQPVAASAEAKLVHALGFDQCAPAYRNEIGAPADEIEAHYGFLRRVVNDPTVKIALFSNTQYTARRR